MSEKSKAAALASRRRKFLIHVLRVMLDLAVNRIHDERAPRPKLIRDNDAALWNECLGMLWDMGEPVPMLWRVH